MKDDGMNKQTHIQWLIKTEGLQSQDGKKIDVYELCYGNDEAILSGWAKHFRNQYCDDDDIDKLRDGTGFSRSEYLRQLIFPDERKAPGPSIRAGDFGEILVADFIEFKLSFWVPRTRYNHKDIPNESTKGCDIVGIRFIEEGRESKDDLLITFEVKTQLHDGNPQNRLQDAIDDSGKDPTRLGFTLNAYKRRYIEKQNFRDADRISRFQSQGDRPYKRKYGAAAIFTCSVYNPALIKGTQVQEHPSKDDLVLLVIKGERFMELVNRLYQRAADEA